MSRLAKFSLLIPMQVQVSLETDRVKCTGLKGDLELRLHSDITVTCQEHNLRVQSQTESKQTKAMLGTTYALLKNMLIGVSQGFEKRLSLQGVGYRCAVEGNIVEFAAGYSHPVKFPLPDGVKATAPSPTELILDAVDKQLLGQTAAQIRAIRPPDAYRGKGIRYADETLRLKEGKKKK